MLLAHLNCEIHITVSLWRFHTGPFSVLILSRSRLSMWINWHQRVKWEVEHLNGTWVSGLWSSLSTGSLAAGCRATCYHTAGQARSKTPGLAAPWSRLILCLAELLSSNRLFIYFFLFFSAILRNLLIHLRIFYNYHISGFPPRPWFDN